MRPSRCDRAARCTGAGDENVLLSGLFDQARYVYRFAKGLLGEGAYVYADNKQRMEIRHKASGTRLTVKSSRARGAFGIVGARIALADEPGAWDQLGGELMADALDTALGKPDSDLTVIYIGTISPARAGWWVDLVRAGSILHLRWQVDHGRPWLGVSPLQHASDTANLAGWLERRLGEEASAPVGSFLPVARYAADPDADLDDTDAALRSDIGRARGQVLAVESQIAQADSPASAPRRDYQTLRFGANPPDGLIQLRDKVTLDIGAACGVPRALLDAAASGQSAREGWRQYIATSVDGLCRRIESQILDQLGVTVSIDTAPLGGRDLGRACVCFRTTHQGRTDRWRRA